MKHFLILALVSIAVLAQAQDFAPIGARWIYGSGDGYLEKFQLSSIKDTIIQDKACRKIESVKYNKYPNKNFTVFEERFDTLNPFFIHQDADTVYIYNSNKKKFDKIYVFNVSKEDTIALDIHFELFPYNERTDFRIVIDSVATETYGTTQLKKYKARALDEIGYGFCTDTAWYLDRVGSFDGFLPQLSCGIPEAAEWLICYKDNEISYPDASSCELPTGVSKKQLQQMFSVYPNPAKDRIWIKSTQEVDKIEIYSIHGNLLRSSRSDQINTDNLNSGQYLLKIYSGNDLAVKSIVVE
jgi:hypothetical protein